MQTPNCLKCELEQKSCPKVRRYGRYYRTSDSSWVQRYRCSLCGHCVSDSTFDLDRGRKSRRKTLMVKRMLASGMSRNRISLVLNMNRKTVVRTMLIESLKAHFNTRVGNLQKGKATKVQFDDLETFEHTKCKPISVTLAVEEKTRRILAYEISSMPAKGKLALKARKLYGPRKDGRRAARGRLFKSLSNIVEVDAVFKSDKNPHYPLSLKAQFPRAKHITYGGKRGSLGGQGELKKTRRDPLFSLNHTCAMFRANVNRLFRKTWCTTKRGDRLYAHLALYVDFHNSVLIRAGEAG